MPQLTYTQRYKNQKNANLTGRRSNIMYTTEDMAEAAKREVLEEIGLEFELNTLFLGLGTGSW